MINILFYHNRLSPFHSLGPDLGKVKQDEVYSGHYKKGYVFLTNGTVGSSAQLYEEALKRKGIDFIKHSRAFEHSGKEDSKMVAFLVKEGKSVEALDAMVRAL